MSYNARIDKAFILAAGLGTRLRPYTLERPKPMVEIDGKSLIDSAIDHLTTAGIKEISVNTHYMGDMLTRHLAQRDDPVINIIQEPDLLDTGGGIKNALSYFEDEPFFCVSSDWLWTDNVANTLQSMAQTWDSAKMDLQLLLQPMANMDLTTASGDYHMDRNGRLTRALDKNGDYMWTSVRILHPRLFADTPDGPFSFLSLMDEAQENGRLYGVSCDTHWHHISSAEDLEKVRKSIDGSKMYA